MFCWEKENLQSGEEEKTIILQTIQENVAMWKLDNMFLACPELIVTMQLHQFSFSSILMRNRDFMPSIQVRILT